MAETVKFLEGIPDILYKYRDWDNEYNRRLLTDSELYFASIEQFNDPFDGTIPYRYDPAQLTDENIFKKYYLVTKEMNPRWTEEEIHKHCYDYQSRGLLKDDTYLDKFIETTKKDFADTFGIISLTTEKNNFLMWSHYSNSHRGFCVGFDKYLLFEQAAGAIAPVTYSTTHPIIDMFEDNAILFHKLVYTKSKIWEHENEFRIRKTPFARRTITLAPETYSEIIFGCQMPQKTRFDILALCAKKFPKTRVFETSLHKTEFKLEILQLR